VEIKKGKRKKLRMKKSKRKKKRKIGGKKEGYYGHLTVSSTLHR
jgi:hypothetical protein